MWTPSTRCPMQVALALRDALGIKTFVETGTAQGDTSFIAAGHFPIVHTVDIFKEAHDTAKKHLRGVRNITQHLGDSPDVLPYILVELGVGRYVFIEISGRLVAHKDYPGEIYPKPVKALFWLDAHYSGGPTTIGKTECPVMEEIQMIRRANQKHCIMVDDMQIFCTAGAERDAKMAGWSQRPADWPSADDIIAAARAEGPCFCMVKDHILFIVPPECERVIMENI